MGKVARLEAARLGLTRHRELRLGKSPVDRAHVEGVHFVNELLRRVVQESSSQVSAVGVKVTWDQDLDGLLSATVGGNEELVEVEGSYEGTIEAKDIEDK